nr:PadR family transcriptional regulator [Corynebacterium lactis]
MPRSTQTQLKKGVLELAILTLIDREELYGAALVGRLQDYPHLSAPSGTVYPLLSRLTANGLIDNRWEESTKGPPRKYYSLTDSGRTMLKQLHQDFLGLSTDMKSLLSEEEP